MKYHDDTFIQVRTFRNINSFVQDTSGTMCKKTIGEQDQKQLAIFVSVCVCDVCVC